MKRTKTIFDAKVGDTVWIVVPGIVNRYNDGFASFPNLTRAEIKALSCLERGEKGSSTIQIKASPGSKFPFNFPTTFAINVKDEEDSANEDYKKAYAYSNYFDDPYFDDEPHYVSLTCIFDKYLAKSLFKEKNTEAEKRIKSFIMSEKKKISGARRTLKALKDNLSLELTKTKS